MFVVSCESKFGKNVFSVQEHFFCLSLPVPSTLILLDETVVVVLKAKIVVIVDAIAIVRLIQLSVKFKENNHLKYSVRLQLYVL